MIKQSVAKCEIVYKNVGQSCIFSTLFIHCDSYIAKAALYFIFSISLLSHSTPRLEYTLSVISEMECPTMRLRAYFSKRMSYVDNALSSIDPSIAKYLKIGVTERVTYDILRIKGCPCCRDLYYEAYRKFFWKLSIERQ